MAIQRASPDTSPSVFDTLEQLSLQHFSWRQFSQVACYSYRALVEFQQLNLRCYDLEIYVQPDEVE